MNKFLLLIALVISSMAALAQQTQVRLNAPGYKPQPLMKMQPGKTPLTRNPGDGPNWFNYGLDYSGLIGSGPFFYILPLFPDTNIIAYTYKDSSGNTRNAVPHYHAAATVVDPYHFFNAWIGSQYSLDSIWLKYLYVRDTPDTSVVDTLLLTVFTPAGIGYGTIGPDTVWWKQVVYDRLTNTIDSPYKLLVIKLPLTKKQSSVVDINHLSTTDAKDLFFDVSGQVPIIDSPNVIGIAVQFVPGYTYSYANGDSLGANNTFYLISTSENNDKNLTQTINDKGNYNYSYVVTDFVRYATDTITGYYPSIGLVPFGAQNHFIVANLSYFPLAVKNISVSNGMNFYPNPSRGEATLDYNLIQNARKTSFKVFDVTGKQLLNIEQGAQAAGTHQLKFDTGNLINGMYFYTFTVDGQSSNGKFIVD